MTMRLIVGVGDEFQCPICGMMYTLLEEEPGTTAIASETGEWCEHLDPEVFPARGEGEYEVYFREKIEE
jgi:hypothetical protein